MLNEVAAALRRKSLFALRTHVQPDGDALGSLLALGAALEQMGKSVVYCAESSERLSFLPGYEKVGRVSDSGSVESAPVEVVIYLDCATQDRSLEGKETSTRNKERNTRALVINIDHHVSNEGFGDIQWIDTGASSVGEMLWLLFQELGIVIDETIAANLYVSIINDTGQFAFSNTTQRTHEVAGALISHEIGVSNLHKKVFYEKSREQTKLLGRALANLSFLDEGEVAVMYLSRDDFDAVGIDDDCEGFIAQAMNIRGVQTAVFVKEKDPQMCKVSFRSRRIDVNRVAAQFGGGGHVRASGCTLKMPLAQALPLLREVLEKAEGDG